MSPQLLMLGCIALPVLASGLVVAAGRAPNLREAVTLAAGALVLGCVAGLYPEVSQGARPGVVLAPLVPGIALKLTVEPLGLLFAMVAGFLWPVTSLYAIGYMRAHHERNQTRFYACFAVSIAAAMGVAFAGNLVTLFVFYEVLTLSTYPLVTHAGTPEARRAGRVYLATLLGTSIAFLLLAIAWTYAYAGTVDFREGGILAGRMPEGVAAVVFCLFAFGVGKAALMPFHRWLPAAMVAPTPVSALLHAVAVVKAGVFTILKVAVYVFGPDLLAASGGGRIIAYVAGATILIGSLVAMNKDNLKARLAYSTISQLSYVVLGAVLASAWGTVGAALHIVMHAFGKITLFFCAGAVLVAAHKTEVSELGGLGRRMPVTMGAFVVASLCIIGLPPLGGAWSKWYLATASVDAGEWVLLGVLLVSSLLSMGYLLTVPLRAFSRAAGEGAEGAGEEKGASGAGEEEGAAGEGAGGGMKETGAGEGGEGHAGDRTIREAPPACLAAILVTAAGCVALFLYPDPFFALVSQVAGAR